MNIANGDDDLKGSHSQRAGNEWKGWESFNFSAN